MALMNLEIFPDTLCHNKKKKTNEDTIFYSFLQKDLFRLLEGMVLSIFPKGKPGKSVR